MSEKENKKRKLTDVQNVRILDVLVVAPLILYSATLKKSPPWLRATLVFLGMATIGYNGYHFLEEEKKRRQAAKMADQGDKPQNDNPQKNTV